MGKHGKSKSGKGAGVQARPAPYTKKPRVEVTYEGGPKDSRLPASASSSATPTASKAVSVGEPSSSSKAKGKAKAVESTTASPADIDVKPEVVPADDLPPFLVIAGSYEKLLYGLQGSFGPSASEDDQPQATLEPTFIFPAHLACVKAIAASPGGKWLATGSEDEFVKVWDLRRKKEVGSLSQHSGSITSLHFPTSSHLISTSVDGTLALFRTSDWALLKSLKGHSGRVNHVDVHPTGRVALSVGKDATLRMWDLMRGRGAASLALGTEAEMVKFSPLGTHFAVLFPKKIEIYSLTLKLLHTLTGPSRFNTLLFAHMPSDDAEVETETEDKEVLCVGTEKGVVEVYEVELGEEPSVEDEDAEEDNEEVEDNDAESSSKQSSAKVERIATLIGHTNRVKSVSSLPYVIPSISGKPARRTVLLTTVSSDGFINIYDLASVQSRGGGDEQPQVRPVGSYDTKGSRLTCVFLAEGRVKANGKGKSQGVMGQSGAVGNGKQVKLEDVRKEEVVGQPEGSDNEEDEAGDDDEGEDEDEDEDEDMYEQDEGSEDEDGVEVEFEDEEEGEEEEEDEEEMEE